MKRCKEKKKKKAWRGVEEGRKEGTKMGHVYLKDISQPPTPAELSAE